MAALTLKLTAGADLLEAARYGVAAGTAAIITEGSELCRHADTEQLFAWVQLAHEAQRVQPLRRERAPAEQRVFSDLPQRVHAHDLHRLRRVRERLAHQAQIVGVELHRLERRQGLIVQDVEVAEDAPGLGVTPAAHETQPASQAQQRQRPCHGLVRGLSGAGH